MEDYSRRKEYSCFHDNQEYTLGINIIISRKKVRFRVQTHEKVFTTVFKWFFRWLHPDIVREISAIFIRE
jgi:hypothetical protein